MADYTSADAVAWLEDRFDATRAVFIRIRAAWYAGEDIAFTPEERALLQAANRGTFAPLAEVKPQSEAEKMQVRGGLLVDDGGIDWEVSQ